MNWDDKDFKRPDDDDDDDFHFDWLNDDDADSVSSDPQTTGITGELDWKRLTENAPDDVGDGDDPSLNWDDDGEHDDDQDDDATETPTPAEGVGKLQRSKNFEEDFDNLLEEAERADFGNTDELLDWMSEHDDQDDDDGEPVSDMPDWLADMEIPKASTVEVEAVRASLNQPDDDTSWLDAADDFGAMDESPGDPAQPSPQEDFSWLDEADDFGASDDGEPIGDDDGGDDGDWLPSTSELDDDDGDWLPATGELDDDDGDWLPATGELDDDDGDWLPATGELDGDDDGDWLPSTGELDDDDDADWLPSTGELDDDDDAGVLDDVPAVDVDAIDWGASLEDVLDDDELPVAEVPDWLAQMKPPETEDDADADLDFEALFPDSDAQASPDEDDTDLDALFGGEMDEAIERDILPTLGVDADETGDDDDELAWLDELDDEMPVAEASTANEALDWFDDAPASDAQPDWLDELDALEDVDLDGADLAEVDFFADLDGDDGEDVDLGELEDLLDSLDEEPVALTDAWQDDAQEATSARKSTPDFDLDALLDSYEADETLIEDEADFEEADLSAILDDITEEKASLEDADIPDWLREVAADVGDASSAAALVRQKKDRPVDDLDDRLLALRERGLNIAIEDDKAPSGMPKAGIDLVTPTEPQDLDAVSLSELVMDERQRKQSAVLDELVSLSALSFAPAQTAEAIDEGAEADALQTATPSRLRLRRLRRLRPQAGFPIGRWLTVVLLLVATIAPFVTDVNLGNPPPADFRAGSPQSDAFVRVASLQAGDYVLVAVEYNGAGVGELDTLTRSLLAHIAEREARPILVSGKPIGLLRGEMLARDLWGESERNQTYSIGRYLVGGTLGLRNLVDSPQRILGTDVRGASTGISLRSLDELALAILISDNAETVRGYMEQVVPRTQAPWLVASSYGATPLVQPYIASVPNIVGALRGFEDGATYERLITGTSSATETRYQAMTTGLAASVVLVFIANFIYIVGVITKRRRG